MKELERAIEVSSLTDHNESKSKLLIKIIEYQLENKMYDDAIKLAQEIPERIHYNDHNFDKDRTFRTICTSLIKEKDYKRAIEAANLISRHEREYAYNDVVMVLLDEDRIDEAVVLNEKLGYTHSTSVGISERIAWYYIKHGMNQKANEIVRSMDQNNVNFGSFVCNVIRNFLQNDSVGEAEKLFDLIRDDRFHGNSQQNKSKAGVTLSDYYYDNKELLKSLHYASFFNESSSFWSTPPKINRFTNRVIKLNQIRSTESDDAEPVSSEKNMLR